MKDIFMKAFQKLAPPLSPLILSLILAACSGDSADSLLVSGKDYLAKNDPKSAIIQLKNAIQKEPDLAEARYLLGSALFKSGDAAGAEIEIRKALERKYAQDQAIPLLAETMLATGQAKKLIDEFSALKLSSGEAQASLSTSLGAAYASLGRRDIAQQKIAEALASQPDYVQALLIDIKETAAGNNIVGAKTKVDALLAKYPTNSEALLIRGNLAVIDKDHASALMNYRKAIAANPKFLPAHSAAISSLLASGKTDEAMKQLEELKKVAPQNPSTYFFEAQLNYQNKNFKAARESAQQLLKIAPNYAMGLQIAGAIEYQLRSYLQAETYLAKALQLAPNLTLARRMLVANYLRAGQPGKALETLQPALADENNIDPAFLALAGEVYLQNSNPNKAAEYLTKASKNDPNNAARKTSLAIAHMAQGNLSTGLQELEQIAVSDSGSTADLALIAAYLRINQLDNALKAINTLEKKQPDNPATHNLRARALLAKKDTQGARKSFEQALSLNPTFFPAVSALANLDLVDKKPEEARKRFESVLSVDPKHMQALLALAELKAISGGTTEEVTSLINKAVSANPTEIPPRIALVQYFLKNKDNQKALSAANEASTAIPGKPEVLEMLGAVQQISGDLNQAAATFSKQSTLQPASPAPLLRLANVQFANNKKEEGLKSLQKALEIKPDLLEAQAALAKFALDNKDYSSALEIAKTIQKQRPKEAAGYILEGNIHYSAKAWPQTIAAFQNGLKQVSNPELAVKLHDTLLDSGNPIEAEKTAASWLKEHPKDIVFRIYLGDLASSQKNYAQAISYYQAALTIQPNNAMVLNNLAWVSGQMKSPKALEYAEKANQLAPNQPALMDTLAMLLADNGQTEKALELLKKATAAAPQESAIQFNLAKTLIKAGKKEEARKELEGLAKLGNKFAKQAEVSQILKSL